MAEKLTASQIQRRIFNKWFSDTLACADGRYAHFPRWLKADLWAAWQAGRAVLTQTQDTHED